MLALPFVIAEDPLEPTRIRPDEIQANFDAIKTEFPLRRRHMAIESPRVVGAAGQPAFLNSWVNYDTGFVSARFWKDPMGIVHVEGVVKNGTIGLTVFTLPVGYRPLKINMFGTQSNSAIGRIDVFSDGAVAAGVGSNVHFSLNCQFLQEA